MLNSFLQKYKDRVVGLDILRSIAILIVVYEHGGYLVPKEFRGSYMEFSFIKIDGVSIFFVLSGFLIGGIFLNTINKTEFQIKDLLTFWIRRWFRTLPNYLLVLVLLLFSHYLVFENFGGFNFKYFIFSQNLTTPHPTFFPEAWSLSVEEWFYLAFPLIFFLIHHVMKEKNKAITITVLLFLFTPLILRAIKYHSSDFDFDNEFRKIVILRLDSLMIGVIASYIATSYNSLWLKYKFQLMFAGVLFIFALYHKALIWRNYYPPVFFNIEVVVTFCFLPLLSSLKTTKIRLLDSIFVFISIISYSMYLLNYTPIQGYILPFINNHLIEEHFTSQASYTINYILFWALTISASAVLYYVYENPMTRLRERFTKSKI